MSEHIGTFLDSWRMGDAQMILGAIAGDFAYDDPIDGHFTKNELAAYLKEVFGSEEARLRAARGEGFETVPEIVTQEKDGVETTWRWWRTFSAEGAGLVMAGPEGVRTEKIACYTEPQPS